MCSTKSLLPPARMSTGGDHQEGAEAPHAWDDLLGQDRDGRAGLGGQLEDGRAPLHRLAPARHQGAVGIHIAVAAATSLRAASSISSRTVIDLFARAFASANRFVC